MRRRARVLSEDLSSIHSEEADGMDELRQQLFAMQQEILQLRTVAATVPQQAAIAYTGPSASDIARELQKVGKLDTFSGMPEKWAEWDFIFVGYIQSMSEEMARLLQIAKSAREPVGNPTDDTG